ncbi:phospholipase A and acyltransferase 1-like [Onychostoma macrolepis]|uniref:phospholipase A and acyltransferase 1-like n=1 Tax=Onychostoma macrolepis TaxID=369639 RepID=UPI00272A2615|nr:phospholipase A and acyltransferase 1-like [Onychostoma macrolepis]
MNFGDLLSYARIGYTHWAVYTGKNENGKDTVVEFTGEKGSNSKAGAIVKQGLLKPGFTVENQWHGQTPQSEVEMSANVEKVLRDGAGKYGILDNNCEHLATFIRYGKAQSLQANRVLNTASDFNNEIADNFGASSFGSSNMKFN